MIHNGKDPNLKCQKDGICWYNYMVAIKMSCIIRDDLQEKGLRENQLITKAFNLERVLRVSILPPCECDKEAIGVDYEEVKKLITNECKNCFNRESVPYCGVSYETVLEIVT